MVARKTSILSNLEAVGSSPTRSVCFLLVLTLFAAGQGIEGGMDGWRPHHLFVDVHNVSDFQIGFPTHSDLKAPALI